MTENHRDPDSWRFQRVAYNIGSKIQQRPRRITNRHDLLPWDDYMQQRKRSDIPARELGINSTPSLSVARPEHSHDELEGIRCHIA